MDVKDRKIVSELVQDARQPLKTLSKKTGLRPSTIHTRIGKLLDEGIIRKFTVQLDDRKMGRPFIVFLWVKTKPSVLLEQSAFASSHIEEVHGITGEYDLMLKMKFKDIEEFNTFLLEFRKNTQIENTLTMIATAVIKD